MTYVYLVSYRVHKDMTPKVTVFDNEKSAQAMFDDLQSQGWWAWMEVLALNHTFKGR